MKTGKMTQVIVTMLMLLISGAAEVWADAVNPSNITIETPTNGTISPPSVSGREVSLTVTPSSGYYIRASDITVEPLVGMDKANSRRRAPRLAGQIAGKLYVGNNEVSLFVGDGTNLATFKFTLPEKYDGAYVSATFTSASGDVTFITSATNVTYTANGHYILVDDVNASDLTSIISGSQSTAFTGTFEGEAKADGTYPVISGLTEPLFASTVGAVIKNVMLDGVSISQSGNVGAIAGEAGGYTRIYNCGILPTSSVASTDGYCGGLVGWLKDDSRVINCFSYATIGGGTDVAGIVGHNEAGSTTAVSGDKYTKLRTAVVNCMFYGDITGGSNRYPVYGGAKMVNNTATGINNYDFYRAEASLGLADNSHYNCSWPAPEDYLTRYEYYRYLLNSNRELCGWWVAAPSAPSTMSTADVQAVPKDASLMAKWVLDTSIAPYPILKKFGKYASPVNIDADASWRTTANEWEGKKLGTLSVTVKAGDHHTASDVNLDIVITDMDTLHSDYCYKKIQLPYYNTVFGNPNSSDWATKYGDNYGDYVVTGWEITSTDGADGTFTEHWQDGYNFADRTCSNKDKYSTSGRIFAQGGYYYVPNDVTAITITAHWASAIYIDNTDHSYDRVYLSNSNAGTHFAPAGYRTAPGSLTVQNGTISSLIPSGGSVFDNALVLVGNHQYRTGGNDVKGTANTDGLTIMSVDLDFDEEPDYCLEWQLGTKTDRQSICPIRFDFLPVIELGMAMKQDGSTQYYSLGCYRPLGHYEVTETALIHFGQFEFSNVRTVDSPIILNGGIFDQYTKGTAGSDDAGKDKITYIILGGNVRMPSFTPGAHVNKSQNKSTRHCAVNVLGGNIGYLYLTGNYNEKVKPNTDNPHCYIDGGRFKQVAAAGKEGINGNVFFKINHSKIWEFYGGSTMDLATGDYYKIVKGNIDVTIDNSVVDKYCGGPKFGDMVSGKTVTTNATGTTFGVYYGGGNGGTSYVQYRESIDGEQTVPYSWDLSNYTPQNYVDISNGYHADYDMEIVNTSAGTNSNNAIYRVYFYSAQFSATNTGPITNNLTNCTVTNNFYGAGNLGGVIGDVTSTLTGTTVLGSAFGAGYSATVPDVTIHEKDKTPPSINVYTAIISPQSGGTSNTYTWTHKASVNGTSLTTGSPIATDTDGKKYFYTEKSLDNLGTVTGNVTLTITGDSKIGTSGTGHDVYGGGDASAVSGNTTVYIQGETKVLGNVFGGGNRGAVSGSATVNIRETPATP